VRADVFSRRRGSLEEAWNARRPHDRSARRALLRLLGWFGPIGVSALLYVTEAIERTGEQALWAPVSLIVCASLIAHGITATPFTRRYAAHAARTAKR
jgi:sodium/hydrogen antiporter